MIMITSCSNYRLTVLKPARFIPPLHAVIRYIVSNQLEIPYGLGLFVDMSTKLIGRTSDPALLLWDYARIFLDKIDKKRLDDYQIWLEESRILRTRTSCIAQNVQMTFASIFMVFHDASILF